ncbi:hypothetical protein C8Q76DRAFT_740471 [Earliella scabrosa]|nr:hypothetical protein C8Q76DRAFT_740471 [Earliella scabrosa]
MQPTPSRYRSIRGPLLTTMIWLWTCPTILFRPPAESGTMTHQPSSEIATAEKDR